MKIQEVKKVKMYYHVLEYGMYGNIGYQGYYDTMEEAKNEAEKLKGFFPDCDFEVFTDTSKKEPPIVTV